jgi:uncharacterized phage protein (TIGR02220 family)
MKEKPTYYAILPADVRYDNDLTPNAKLLYAEITVLTQSNGVCWASDNYFMELYNVKRQSIQRWLKSLEDRGYIKREVIYKNNSNEIEKRFIRVYTEKIQGYTQYCYKGIHNNDTVNNTSINTTSNNIKDIVELEEIDKIPYQEIIDYLNIRTQKNYRLTDAVKTSIRARVNEGFALDDFKTVIDKKCVEWSGTEMAKYLRPQTLFGTKFDSYLNQEVQPKKNSNPYLDMQFDSEGNLI